MPLYDYLCDTCGARFEMVFSIHDDSSYALCPNWADGNHPTPRDPAATPREHPHYARKIITSFPGVTHGMVREPHYNMTVGKVVRNDSEFKSELSRQSDEASERNGFPVNFQPIDHRDAGQELGVTDEGMDSTYATQVKQGTRPVIKHL